MAGLIPQDFINELINRVDIVEVVGSRMELKKKGKSHVGLCPFHTEKTGSFNVVSDKQFYHCFGCGASGTALTFLLEHDRLDFVEAVETLAASVGMEVPREAGRSSRRKPDADLYQVLESATRFFRSSLRDSPDAIAYLKGRGLTGEVARDFGVGYAPDSWDGLRNALADVPLAKLRATGLVSENESGRTYDRFRGRIMFPIRDTRGRTIAFGGRVLDGGEPKYLNSPETELFHKGQELYGLFEARRAVREIDRFVLVEGYMDVVALAQAGVPTAVATLGTASSDTHFNKLYRFTSEIVCCFDGDRAGRAAAWKAMQNALGSLKDGRQLKFLFLPDGEDPDTMVRKEGLDKFRQRLDGALPLSDYFFNELTSAVDLTSLEGKARLAEMAKPHLSQLPDGVLRQLLYGRLAALTDLASGQLGADAGQARGPRHSWQDESPQNSPDYPEQPDWLDEGPPSLDPLSRRVLSAVLRLPTFLSLLDDDSKDALLGYVAEEEGVLAEVVRFFAKNDGADVADLLGYLMGDPAHAVVVDVLDEVTPVSGASSLLGELTDGIAGLVARRERRARGALLARMREEGSTEALAELMARKRRGGDQESA
ncbi:MAG: DNA primase [Pseudomonadaceae bacterium]|nr:DNA primase [Pseudomonadaceae bacterium]